MSNRQRIVLAVFALPVILLLLIATTPQGRAAVRAALFVTEVVPGIPMKPLGWFAPDLAAERVTFPIPEGVGTGDLYLPGSDGEHPGVLLFLGVAPAGADDPRVVRLGRAFARSGMVALFYWSPHMAERRITSDDIGNLVAAFEYMERRPEVDADRLGIGGFCVGASFALIASADSDIRENVRYVNAFGPYYDMRELAVAISSRSQIIAETVHSDLVMRERGQWEPDPLTQEVFTRLLIDGVDDDRDRQWLLDWSQRGRDDSTPDSWAMSYPAQAVYGLLGGLPLQEARAAVRRLSPSLLAEMDRTSPKSYLGDIEATVLIMHDRQDNLVPAQESRYLAAALEAQGSDASYTEFSFFQHVDPTRPVPPLGFIRESGKLFWHMYRVMRAAW